MNLPANTTTKWELFCRPTKDALKTIKGGRLSGMTDVNPQWRYKAMHDAYGPCGEGWKYEITRTWTEPGLDGQMFAFASVYVQVKSGDKWSDPIPGVGGSMLLEKEKNGIHHNDEAFKMAITDALSVSLKMLGVAADIYMGRWDGSKYKDDPASSSQPNNPRQNAFDALDDVQKSALFTIVKEGVEIYRETGDLDSVIDFFKTQDLSNEEKASIPYFLGNEQTEDGKKLATAYSTLTKQRKGQ